MKQIAILPSNAIGRILYYKDGVIMRKFNTMKDTLTAAVNRQRHPKRPVKYWEARIQTGTIDLHENIAILKARYGSNVTYKAIR